MIKDICEMHRRFYIAMVYEFLGGSNIVTTFQQMSRK
jgi:hypothetical protein